MPSPVVGMQKRLGYLLGFWSRNHFGESKVPVTAAHTIARASCVLLLGKTQTNQTAKPESCDAFVWVNIAMTCLFPWLRISPVEIYSGKLSTTLLSHDPFYSCLAMPLAWEPGGWALHSEESARRHFAQKAGKEASTDWPSTSVMCSSWLDGHICRNFAS